MIRRFCRVSIAALGISLPVTAQQPERAAFYVLSGRDTVTAERFERGASTLSGEVVDRVRGGRIRYTATLASNALVTRLERTDYRNAADTVGQRSIFTFAGDTMIAQVGTSPPTHVPSSTGVLAVLNPAVAFWEQMVLRARVIGGDTAAIPVFVIGAPQPLPLTVTRISADSTRLVYAGVSVRLATSANGRVLGGGIPDQRVSIVRGAAVDRLDVATRDYSAPAGAPYTAEDVVVRTPAGLRPTGTLTIPRARPDGRVPAIVTITGSGPQDRDAESVTIAGYRPFREIADTLGRRGIAVLRLDDRGVNGSEAGPPTATSADYADDIRAGLAYLRSRPEIDGRRIGLLGHSEGGIIAPMIASTDPEIRAMVIMAANASPGRAIVAQQNLYSIDSLSHLQGATRDSAIARAARGVETRAATLPWLKFFLDYDPSIVARQLRIPVLILHGETDTQVPPSEAEKLASAFRVGASGRVTVRTFPETNHLFLADPNGAFADATGNIRYGSLPSKKLRPVVVGAIVDWLIEQLR